MMYEKLLQDKKLLEKQLFWIDISFQECSHIGLKEHYSIEELITIINTTLAYIDHIRE